MLNIYNLLLSFCNLSLSLSLHLYSLFCTNQTFISINFFLFSCAFLFFFSNNSLKHFRIPTVDGAKIVWRSTLVSKLNEDPTSKKEQKFGSKIMSSEGDELTQLVNWLRVLIHSTNYSHLLIHIWTGAQRWCGRAGLCSFFFFMVYKHSNSQKCRFNKHN